MIILLIQQGKKTFTAARNHEWKKKDRTNSEQWFLKLLVSNSIIFLIERQEQTWNKNKHGTRTNMKQEQT